MISSSQRPLPDNTRHSQQTNIHAPGGIRTHDLSRRAAAGDRSYRTRCPIYYLVGTLCVISCIFTKRSERKDYVCRDYRGVAECTTRGAGSNTSVPTEALAAICLYQQRRWQQYVCTNRGAGSNMSVPPEALAAICLYQQRRWQQHVCTNRGAGSNMSVPTRHLRGRFYARWRHTFLLSVDHVLVGLITTYWQALLFSSIGWQGQFIIWHSIFQQPLTP